jgi:thiol-disulfide isomerase/thioredoxin
MWLTFLTLVAAMPASRATMPAVGPDVVTVFVQNDSPRPMGLHLWASWCVPCVRDLPALSVEAAALTDVNVIFLSVDPPASRFTAQRLLSSFGVPAGVRNVWFESSTAREDLMRIIPEFKGKLPFTVVLEPGGVVRRAWTGSAPGALTAALAAR